MVPTRWTRWTQERAATAYTGTVLAGFAAVVLGPSLLGFRTLISVNTLTGYFPWRADGVQVVGHERCTGDTIDTVMPSIAYIRGEWLHGHLGAWQSLIGGGSAVGALPSDGLLDPLSLPYFVLPLWLAPAFVKLLEILVGGGGTYLFLRRLGVSRPAGMIAGAVFATSGFMVMWTNWPQTRVAALIPALFWAIERLVQRLRFSDAALIALVVASIVLGGFPSVTAWALEAGALYFVVRLVVEYRDNLRTAGRALGLGVGGLAVGGLLAMIELLPFAKVYSDVSGQRSGYGLTPLAAVRLVTLISPGAYGLCVGGEPKYDGSSPIEDVAFVGAAAMLLAVVGACVRLRLNARRADGGSAPRVISGRGVTMFFAATAVVIVLIGWSSSTFLRHLQFLPPFHGNPVGRIRAVLGFALAVLVGFGVDAVTQRRTGDARPAIRMRPGWSWLRPAVIAGGVLAVGVAILAKVRSTSISQGDWLVVKPTLYVPALLIAATFIVLALAATRRPWARWLALLALPLLVVGQGAYFFHRVLPGDNPDDFYRRTPVHQYLSQSLGHERYDTTGMVMYPSTSLYYGLRTATGHTTQPEQWIDLLRAVDPKVLLTPTFTAFSSDMTPDRVGASTVLDQLGVRYWVFGPDVVAGQHDPLPVATSVTTLLPGASAECTLGSGPVRGVSVGLAAPVRPAVPSTPAIISVTATNGGRVITSAYPVTGEIPAGHPIAIALPGEQFGAGATYVRLSARGTAGPIQLAATTAGPSCAAVRPTGDGLRLVGAFSGGVVYERLTALPRIRWSGTAMVVPDPAAQLAALTGGVPTGTVLLPAAAGPSGGGTAQLAVLTDVGGRVTVEVDAQAPGYVTVADSMTQHGWSVSVDGHSRPLLIGDHALGTVAVPAGRHDVVFRYSAPGLQAGIALSAVGAALLAALVTVDVMLRRRSARERHGDRQEVTDGG